MSEHHFGELLEGELWEFVVFFSDEIFIVPMSVRLGVSEIMITLALATYACSTWKHIRSSDVNSSSGRLRMNRLGERLVRESGF